MITFRYIFLVSDVSVNFGESESSLVDNCDKSLVEGMLVTEKKEMAPLQNETTRFILVYLFILLCLSGSKYIEVKLKHHVICSCCLVYWMN